MNRCPECHELSNTEGKCATCLLKTGEREFVNTLLDIMRPYNGVDFPNPYDGLDDPEGDELFLDGHDDGSGIAPHLR